MRVRGFPSGYPLERGIIQPIGNFDYLLWTQGNCSELSERDFYKEGKGIPYPLRVSRHLGSGDCHQSAREILGLTKMNWNNDGLYDRLPVSISYASVLARCYQKDGITFKDAIQFPLFYVMSSSITDSAELNEPIAYHRCLKLDIHFFWRIRVKA